MIDPSSGTDRGVSTVVSHVLAIGITSILVMGLLLAAGSYLEDQKEYAAREELETVGYTLANSLAQIDQLSAQGANVTTWSRLPERISGESYDARVATGSSCEEPNADPDTCLIVNSNGLGVSQKIPLEASNDIVVTQVEPGRFKMTAPGPHPTPKSVRNAGVVELAMRVGIGRDVDEDSTGRNLFGSLNLPPTNLSITMDPEWPSVTRDIQFRGDAVDPDAENPDAPCCLNYTWDLTGDDVVDVNNDSAPQFNYDAAGLDPGLYNVTLNVTDKPGASTIVSQMTTVTGLSYVPGSMTTTDADSGDNVTFEMTNEWPTKSVAISRFYFNPMAGADEIEAEEGWERICDPYCSWEWIRTPEILIDAGNDGDWDNVTYLDSGRDIPETGLFVSVGNENYRDAIYQSVGPGDDVRIRFSGVQGLGPNPDDAGYHIGVTHFVDGHLNTTRFRSAALDP
jgi:hypothetical protein